MIDLRNFVIKVAGVNIGISTLSTGTYGYCIRYISDEKPDVCITVTKEDVERVASSGKGTDPTNTVYNECIAVYEKIIDALLDYDCFMMHGAVIAIDNNAWMFSADSGTGKTTHIKQWLRHKKRVYIVNGDKPIIRFLDGQIYACGTPWCGKERLGTNTMVPLRGIAFLERNEYNTIREMPFAEAYLYLLQHVHVQHDVEKAKKTLCLVRKLDHKVLYYDFKINNFKDDCFNVAYDAMVGNK